MEAKELVLTLEWERVIDAFLWAHKICGHSPKAVDRYRSVFRKRGNLSFAP